MSLARVAAARRLPTLLLAQPLRGMAGAAAAAGPMAAAIDRKLRAALNPSLLRLTNESHLHAGHAGNPGGGPDAETHFRLECVSEAFEKMPLVQRHRTVYELVAAELAAPGGVHALALVTRTPAEAERAAAKAAGGGT